MMMTVMVTVEDTFIVWNIWVSGICKEKIKNLIVNFKFILNLKTIFWKNTLISI